MPGNRDFRLAAITCSIQTNLKTLSPDFLRRGAGTATSCGKLFGNLQAREVFVSGGVPQYDGEIHAEIRDVGKGAAGIEGERR